MAWSNIILTIKNVVRFFGDIDIPKTTQSTPVVKLTEAQQIIDRTKRDIRGEPDMDPGVEICKWAEETWKDPVLPSASD